MTNGEPFTCENLPDRGEHGEETGPLSRARVHPHRLPALPTDVRATLSPSLTAPITTAKRQPTERRDYLQIIIHPRKGIDPEYLKYSSIQQ